MSELLFDQPSHTYTLDGVVIPSVSQVITAGDTTNYPPNGAAERGTRVHRVLELLDKGELSQDYIAAIKGREIEAFIDTYQAWRLKLDLVANEEMYHGQLDGLAFAGTIDRVLKIGDYLAVVDIKTGRPYPKPHAMQVWAYGTLYTQATGREIEHHGCVYLDGRTAKLRMYGEPEALDLFRRKLAAYYGRKHG